jgi:hypothetical protein
MNRWHRSIAAVAGVTALLVGAAPAAAQICAGQPTEPGQTSIGLRGSFPSEGTTLGVEASRNWNNPMGAFVSFNLLLADDDEVDNTPIFGGGLAYEVGSFIPAVPAWLSICPVGAVTFATANDVTQLTVPLGVGFGTTFGTPDFSLHPFLIPQFVLTRVSVDDVSVSDNNFGFGAGGFVKMRGVYAGLTVGKILVEGSDTDVAFQLGLVFPPRR